MLLYIGLGFIAIGFTGLAGIAYLTAEALDREFDKLPSGVYCSE